MYLVWFGLVYVVTRMHHSMLPRRAGRRMQATPFKGFRAGRKFFPISETTLSPAHARTHTLGQRQHRWVLPMPNEGLRASGQARICARRRGTHVRAHAGARTP